MSNDDKSRQKRRQPPVNVPVFAENIDFAAPRQRWYTTAQIGVHAFYCKGISFIVDSINMLSWKNNVQIPAISISTIFLRFRCPVYDLLERLRRLIHTDAISHNLSRFSTNHCYHYFITGRNFILVSIYLSNIS